jgi:hypothetical protein
MSCPRFASLILACAALAIVLAVTPAGAHTCWTYTLNHPANTPLPWMVDLVGDGRPAPIQQMISDEHDNWTWEFFNAPCTGTTDQKTSWGNSFIDFHRQFNDQYDYWRLENGFDRVELWDPAPNAPMPGDNENTTTPYTHCQLGGVRPAGAPCATCKSFPTSMVGPDSLSAYANVGLVGSDMQCKPNFNGSWHSFLHAGTSSAAGGVCQDMNDFQWNPSDPVFWMTHRKLDVTGRDYLRLAATDLVLVVDRSSTMDDNCPGGNADAGESPCRLNDAKEAAKIFADLVQNVRPGTTGQHTIGLVSFGSTATKEMSGALVAAAGVVTNNGTNDTPFEQALAGISAGGSGTSIAAGIAAAREILATGTNQHKAIVLLSNHAEDTAPWISSLPESLGSLDICVIGFGSNFADPGDSLRSLAEFHGGIFLADPDLSDAPATLMKFFVNCFGQVYDEALDEDPVVTLPAGAVSTTLITTTVCTTDRRITYVMGREYGGSLSGCDLTWNVITPAGNLVDISGADPNVEYSKGPEWSFVRITLPYKGEQAGNWTAIQVRPQTTFVNPFATDAWQSLTAGTAIMRNEIHRLIPTGANTCLYYEDGSRTGTSAYRNALNAEVAAGTIKNLTTAASAANFNTLLAQNWDLIVFARQLNPTAQVYDAALQAKICGGQRALITDFYNVGASSILSCAGAVGTTPNNYGSITGDGRFFTGTFTLRNTTPPYTTFDYTVNTASGGPWLIQATTPTGGGCVIGNGTNCGAQNYFYSSLVRGYGKVEPIAVRPRILVGQDLLATFRMTEPNRPSSGWDAVSAQVTLDRPGAGSLETYTLSDNGTNGDLCANNNYWTRDITLPATVAGPHLLHAAFTLTENGCAVHREADYTIVVENEPSVCTHVTCVPLRIAAGGDSLDPLVCVSNRCVAADSFEVTVSDTRGWLYTGNRVPVNGNYTFHTSVVPGGKGICFPEVSPVYVVTPVNAENNDSTTITYLVHSLGRPSQPDQSCTVTVRNVTGIVSVPPPPAQTAFGVTVVPDMGSHMTKFRLRVPQSGEGQLRIYDMRGRLVSTVFDGHVPGPEHPMAITWTGRDANGRFMASGIYNYRFTFGSYRADGTVLLLH